MRIVRMGAALACSLVFATLIAAQNTDYTPDPTWKAPAQAAAKANPLGRSPAAAKKGAEIYESRCTMCHGTDGRGIANAANFHVPAVQKESDGTLFWKMSNGHTAKGMPSFGYLPEEQRWELVTYIRSLQKNGRK